MKYSKQLADDLQILADFCGPRDVEELTRSQVQSFFQGREADVLVLFGGSIAAAVPLFARAIQENPNAFSVIVGGYGHTTEALQKQMEKTLGTVYPTEAETFQAALIKQGVQADALETRSTNCGNNIEFLLDLLDKQNIHPQRLIFIQDASMQKRMEATLARFCPDIKVLNYAASKTRFGSSRTQHSAQGNHEGNHKQDAEEDNLIIVDPPEGMWSAEKYASLLMGEISRLQDNEQGYGPAGKNFIAHVEIPEPVLLAYQRIKAQYPELVRMANPAYAQAEQSQKASLQKENPKE